MINRKEILGFFTISLGLIAIFLRGMKKGMLSNSPVMGEVQTRDWKEGGRGSYDEDRPLGYRGNKQKP